MALEYKNDVTEWKCAKIKLFQDNDQNYYITKSGSSGL